MMIDILIVLVLGLAGFRITRALLFDTWIEGTRHRFYAFLVNRKRPAILWQKLLDLTTCTWCAGFWVSLTLTALYLRTYPWQFTIEQWISTFAVAAVQALLHVFEPDEE